jgi:hypothetical protein
MGSLRTLASQADGDPRRSSLAKILDGVSKKLKADFEDKSGFDSSPDGIFWL